MNKKLIVAILIVSTMISTVACGVTDSNNTMKTTNTTSLDNVDVITVLDEYNAKEVCVSNQDTNYWEEKKIVWLGTSIPAGG